MLQKPRAHDGQQDRGQRRLRHRGGCDGGRGLHGSQISRTQTPRQSSLSAKLLFRRNDFGDLLSDRCAYFVVVEILKPERNPQRRPHEPPSDL